MEQKVKIKIIKFIIFLIKIFMGKLIANFKKLRTYIKSTHKFYPKYCSCELNET